MDTKCEGFYQDILKLLVERQVVQIICLGLGHFSSCPIARLQLSFLVALSEDLSIANVQLQDPAFVDAEKDYLVKTLNFGVLEENVEGKIAGPSNKQVLYYLPHCPKQLTNNVLWRNWSAESLSGITLICNSFQNLVTTKLDRILALEAAYIQRLEKYTTELPFRITSERYLDVFNDTSLHYFDWETIKSIESDFWKNDSEPQYPDADIELITASAQSLHI